MQSIKVFKKGERVRLEYEIEDKFMKDGEIYYTLRNPNSGTYLKGCAFTADELIPVEDQKGEADEAN